MQDLDMILDMCSNMKGVTICVLSDACAMPVEAMINKFRQEFEYHITEKRCMAPVLTSPVAAVSGPR
jgi:NADH-quinone oxidoreductase subunit F